MSESASVEKLEKISATIRGLLAKAESSEFPLEAAAFHAKAEELMRKYRIEEEELIAEDAFSITPIVREIVISNSASDFYLNHLNLWAWAANHVGVLSRAKWVRSELIVTAVGYASDIRLAEALFQNAWMTLVGQLEPKVDPKLSDLENVYRLRSAGIERNRVAQMMWDSPLGKDGHAAHAKVGKLYALACEERGEKPLVAGKGLNKAIFREQYGESFVSRFAERLRAARDAVDSVAGLPSLYGREERVKEAFWTKFPDERPEAKAEARAQRDAARVAEGTVARREPKWTKADQRRWEQRTGSVAAYAGQAAGIAAANKVELGRKTEPAKRVEPSGNGIALGG